MDSEVPLPCTSPSSRLRRPGPVQHSRTRWSWHFPGTAGIAHHHSPCKCCPCKTTRMPHVETNGFGNQTCGTQKNQTVAILMRKKTWGMKYPTFHTNTHTHTKGEQKLLPQFIQLQKWSFGPPGTADIAHPHSRGICFRCNRSRCGTDHQQQAQEESAGHENTG